MKKNKRTGKMPMHTFTFLKDHTIDRFYRKGEKLLTDDCQLATSLIKNKIIK